MHEYLHATWSLYTLYQNQENEDFQHDDLDKIKAFMDQGMDSNEAQHKLMETEYMGILKDAIRELHPDIGNADLTAIASYGIVPLTSSQNSINNKYRNGTKGTNCK